MLERFHMIKLSDDELLEEQKLQRSLELELENMSSSDSKSKHIKKYTNKIKDSDTTVISWRFNEWDYYSKKVKLPIKARGLFTLEKTGEIVARGYDKFFNVNELPLVKEEILRNDTIGPYTITVKNNGCIILVSGTENNELVVCSKHSTGDRSDITKNHATVAQAALELQLSKVNMSPKEFANILYSGKITVLCEYCDDGFEEHVLEYKNDKAGLYLHGMNLNTVNFKTYPMDKVNEFAQLYGFKQTDYILLDTFDETLEFARKTNETGKFKGEEIEGFVIRCFQKDGSDFFFKYKFEEPYLLYRELREVTKQYIINGPKNLKFGNHKLICMDYIKFITPLLKNNQILKDDYCENRGIIELRKKYFESKDTTSMKMIKDELNMVELEEDMKSLKFNDSNPNKYVLVTVATIGCGKTTTATGITNLFPDLIGHVQNDNMGSGKYNLIKAALEVLKTKNIVIVDKNNHKFSERQSLFQMFDELNDYIPKKKLKFICLNFLQSSPTDNKQLWDLTTKRIINRGDNHQSIKASSDGIKNAEGIMKGFIKRFQPLDSAKLPDSLFDLVINLDVTTPDSSLKNMKKIVSVFNEKCKDIVLPNPTDQQFLEAFEAAKNYKPTFNKSMKQAKKPKLKVSYFGINIDLNLEILKNLDFFQHLKGLNRVQTNFHVTLFHMKMKKQNLQVWKFYENILLEAEKDLKIDVSKQRNLLKNYSFDIKYEKIVWNNSCMCIQVKILNAYRNNKLIELCPIAIPYPHITIGTVDPSIPPVNSGIMLSEMYDFNVPANVVDISHIPILEKQPLMVFLNV